jgi:hypothetical protein
MRCELFGDVRDFCAVAEGFLAENEAENTVLLGAALGSQRKPKRNAVMAVVRARGAVRLAAIMVPPYPLALSAGDPEAIPHLVASLRRVGTRPPGVSGPEPMADRFAALWRDDRRAAEPDIRMILYRANRMTPPGSVPGELRTAAASDLDELAAWQRRFAEQAGLSAADQAADTRAIVAARIARGEMHVWTVEGRSAARATPQPASPPSASSSWIEAGAIA